MCIVIAHVTWCGVHLSPDTDMGRTLELIYTGRQLAIIDIDGGPTGDNHNILFENGNKTQTPVITMNLASQSCPVVHCGCMAVFGRR